MGHPWFRPWTQINKICPSAIPVCHRQSHSTGATFSWADPTPPASTLRQHGEECEEHKGKMHFLWLQDYGYYCSMDNLSLPPGWAAHPVFQRGLQGSINKQPHSSTSLLSASQWHHIKYAGGCQPSSVCPARGSRRHGQAWKQPLEMLSLVSPKNLSLGFSSFHCTSTTIKKLILCRLPALLFFMFISKCCMQWAPLHAINNSCLNGDHLNVH